MNPRILVAHNVGCPAGAAIVEELLRYGYDARGILDCRRLLEVTDAANLHGAVIELALPEGRAFETGALLRQRFGADLRLVGFTAQNAPQLAPLGLAAGFDEVLVEPANAAEVLLAIGGPTSALVRRSAMALFAWHCALVESGFHQIGHEQLRGDASAMRRRVEAARKIVERVRTYLGDETIEPDRRSHLLFQLALLEKALERHDR